MIIRNNQEQLKQIIEVLFSEYIEKKRTRKLYKEGIDIPKKLLMFYYQLNPNNRHLDNNSEYFFKHYIACESILENSHMHFEKQGLKAMYEYLFSEEINENFDIYTILDLHQKLFSKAPHPESGGHFRNDNVFLPHQGIELSDWRYIWIDLKNLEEDYQRIKDLEEKVKNNNAYLFTYIEECIKLNCHLIKIHPFFDGNGRTIRAFLNKLFINVGLPPIYISSKENKKYREAMTRAISEEENYEPIINFYYFKICDSIIELEKSKTSNNPTFETIMQIVNDVKNNITKEQIHDCFDEQLASTIKDYLDEKDITAQIIDVTFFEPSLDPHAFVMANYQDGDKTKQMLIDPLFNCFTSKLKINPQSKSAPIIENLTKYGVTSINGSELINYINLFYQVQKESKTLTKKLPK